MKKIVFCASAFVASILAFAQTASDYYLPLCIGNYNQLYASVVQPSPWSPRTLHYEVIQADTINGKLYFLEEATEITVFPGSVFRRFWLRENSNGEIVLGAFATAESNNIDSAFILPVPFVLFPHNFLTPGFSRTIPSGANEVDKDSVISISASVNGFTNCLQIRNSVKTNGVLVRLEDLYYAPQIGLVHINRTFPPTEAHTANYVSHNNSSANCVIGIAENDANMSQALIVYPNPASDVLSISTPLNNWTAITICDLQGRVLPVNFLSKTMISTATLAPGMYILTIASGTNKVAQRFIKR